MLPQRNISHRALIILYMDIDHILDRAEASFTLSLSSDFIIFLYIVEEMPPKPRNQINYTIP